MVDRVERSDLFNAVALAAVLLALGWGTLQLIGLLSSTVGEGLWEAEGNDTTVIDTDIVTSSGRLPAEIVVRVGNASEGRQGLAGRATRRLAAAGYGTLEAVNKNGDPIDDSLVYHIPGFDLDAVSVAEVLRIDADRIRPLLGDPGVSTEGADIIVLLGQNADF
jgi:hypothetical protein